MTNLLQIVVDGTYLINVVRTAATVDSDDGRHRRDEQAQQLVGLVPFSTNEPEDVD